MRDSELWAGLAAAFSYPGTGPRDGSWEARLPGTLARRARKVGRARLETEHIRLFVNAVPEVPCPPYASWYLEGQLVGHAATRLRRLYRRCGIDVREEAPDHIAVQLAFAAAMMESTAVSAGAYAIEPELILSGLREWTPRFFEDVRQADRTGFYAAAANACQEALARAGAGRGRAKDM